MRTIYHCLIFLALFVIATYGLGLQGAQARDGLKQIFARATLISGASNSTTTASAFISTTQAPNPFIVNSACSEFNAIITLCEAATPGFNYLAASDQAYCICNNPKNFDGAASTCASYLSIANSTIYSQISTLESFCSFVSYSSTPSLTKIEPSTTSIIASPTETEGAPSTTVSGPGSPTTGPASLASPALPGLRALTKSERIGISAGCGAAALLAGIGIYSAVARRRYSSATEEEEKAASTDLRGASVGEGGKGQKAKKEIVNIRNESMEIG